MTAADRDWANVARASRDALALLGWPIARRCLPGEDDPCGGSFAEHAVAHLVTLQAVAGHQLTHLRPPRRMTETLWRSISRELRQEPCQLRRMHS